MWPGVLSRSTGLWYAEECGTWSTGKVVLLEFLEPLPERFNIEMVALAFGPNIDKEHTISDYAETIGHKW